MYTLFLIGFGCTLSIVMLVSEVMTHDIVTVTPITSFEDVVNLLVLHQISGVPVINENNHVIGVVSEKDILLKLFPSEEHFYTDPEYFLNYDRIESEVGNMRTYIAKDFMSQHVIWVKPEDHILKACALLLVHKVRRLPVLQDHRAVGIVTTRDIYGKFLHKISTSSPLSS